ncbi:MAG: pilus assembly protein [Coriobacteriales bacterium]|nr:pilus assembly protein [Coriobacteriales bacterium]
MLRLGAEASGAPPARRLCRRAGTALCSSRGQGTVEAAVFIPLMFLLILMLCQPGILLYNRMVMENAAYEGCRLLATKTVQGSYSDERYEEYIRRRLAAIPPVDIFHVRGVTRSWKIEQRGDENAAVVSVRIVNKVRPLPLLGWGAELLGMCDARGYLTQEVEASAPSQPEWAHDAGAGTPQDWVEQWD